MEEKTKNESINKGHKSRELSVARKNSIIEKQHHCCPIIQAQIWLHIETDI